MTVKGRKRAPRQAAFRVTDPPGPVRRRFKDILADETVRERWEKVQQYFFLRESTYDMTNRCNLQCDGCYYYEGDKQFAQETKSTASWRGLMRAEKERGITYVVLAGAEPALVPELLRTCHEEIPLGAIATNGSIRIPGSVGYRIHVSVWGNDDTSLGTRRVKRLLDRQMENYAGDERAVFVYTYTRENISEAGAVVARLAANGCMVTFNVFSSPVGYVGNLRHTRESLLASRESMMQLMARFPENIVFSPYSAIVHTHESGLHANFGCSYPRRNASKALGLGRSFRQYHTDLTWDRSASCCVPDTDCDDCRHYAAGSAIVTARLHRHATDPWHFKAWLDYVDAYLAVWVVGYVKGKDLLPVQAAPSGFNWIPIRDVSKQTITARSSGKPDLGTSGKKTLECR